MISEAVSARLPVVGVAPRSPPLHRRGAELSRASSCDNRLVPRAADRRAYARRLSPHALAEIEPIEENPLDALAAKLKERLPQLFGIAIESGAPIG